MVEWRLILLSAVLTRLQCSVDTALLSSRPTILLKLFLLTPFLWESVWVTQGYSFSKPNHQIFTSTEVPECCVAVDTYQYKSR